MRTVVAFVLLAAGSAAATDVCSAQSERASAEVGLSAGLMQYDGAGTSTSSLVGIAGTMPLNARWLLFDGVARYASVREESVDPASLRVDRTRAPLALVDAQLQAQLPFRTFRPYVGLGGGVASYLSGARADRVSPSVSASIGARVPIYGSYLVRGEMRLRGWNMTRDGAGYGASAADWTLGVARRF